MLGDVEREARLAHRRPGGHDDQVALLEAGRQRVEVGEARTDAADLAAVGMEIVEPVVGRRGAASLSWLKPAVIRRLAT